MTKFIDSFDFEIEELTKYIDFEDLEIISKDLTPGEIKEREAIDNKYKELLEKLKTELADLHPEGPPKNKYSIENYKEWKEYEKKGSKEWHDKRNELYNSIEDYKKQVDDFIIKVQERRFTEIIKNVGIEKFFQNRIKAAEAAIKKAINENKDPKTKVYTEYGLNEIIKTYKEVIEISKDVLDKAKFIKKEDIKDLGFSEILELLNNQDLETNNFLQNYCILPNSPVTKFVKNISIAKSNTKAKEIPRNKNVKVRETIDLEGGRGIYDYINAQSNYQVVIDDLKALISKKSISVRKTFNFILIKANQQNKPRVISFNLEEYQKMAGYKTKNSAYRGAIRNFETLRGISIGKSSSNYSKSNYIVSYIFTALKISYNQCYVECNPSIIETLCEYYTLFPTWAGELNTKAYDLLDYIFYMARQSQNLKNIKDKNIFNVSLKSINQNIGGHDPGETQRHTEYIINPILDAIEEIEETQAAADRTNIKITPIYNHDYKNAYDFLEGYLEIELDDEALNYYIDRNAARIKEVKKTLAGKSKKAELPTS